MHSINWKPLQPWWVLPVTQIWPDPRLCVTLRTLRVIWKPPTSRYRMRRQNAWATGHPQSPAQDIHQSRWYPLLVLGLVNIAGSPLFAVPRSQVFFWDMGSLDVATEWFLQMVMLPLVNSCAICFPLEFMLVSSADVHPVNAKRSTISIVIAQRLDIKTSATIGFQSAVLLNSQKWPCHGTLLFGGSSSEGIMSHNQDAISRLPMADWMQTSSEKHLHDPLRSYL